MKLRNPEVRLEVTSRCNSCCPMCPREELTRAKCTMPTEHFMDLTSQSRDLGAEVIGCFGFGEPLLDKELHYKIGYATAMGVDTFITTNASLLNKAWSHALVSAGLGRIRFSVHGLKDTYENLFPFKWNRIMEGIDYFLSINEHTKTDVSVIPMNGESLHDILALWRPKVDEIEVWEPHNWANTGEYRKGKVFKRTCGRPFNGPVQINADGKMMVCCFDFDAQMTVGDTYDDSIETILRGERFESIRHAHRIGDLEGLPCAECDQLYDYAESPLLYSTIDKTREFGRTSTIKYKLEED